MPHPFPLPRSSIVDSAIINFVICVVFEIVSHGMCSNVDVSLISDINVAVVNFALLVLSTHELFACFCTHHVLERSMEHTFSFSSIFWTRQTISSFGVTYTCGFQTEFQLFKTAVDSIVDTPICKPQKVCPTLRISMLPPLDRPLIVSGTPLIAGCCGDRPRRDPYKCVLKA